jgi:DNA replication protein DnaC
MEVNQRLSEQVQERRSRWNVPLRYLAEPIENAQWQAELDRLRGFLGTGMLVVLSGGRGTGKTYLAVELLKIVTGWNREGLYRTLMEFFMLLRRASKFSEPGSEEDVMRRHEHASLLVLDEVGKCGQTDWEDNVLFELLNRRYGARKDTVLVCNYRPDQLLEVLGPSILSRIQETGGVVVCDWPSFRENEVP